MNLLDFLYPRNCLGCKVNGVYICKSCLRGVPKAVLLCPLCQRPAKDGKAHGVCVTPLSIDSHIALWSYKGVVRKAIIALKYKFAFDLIEEIACLSAEEIDKRFNHLKDTTYILVPIPTARLRYNWRGFNQAEELGKLIAKKLNWKILPDLLIKRSSKTQTGLKRKERKMTWVLQISRLRNNSTR